MAAVAVVERCKEHILAVELAGVGLAVVARLLLQVRLTLAAVVAVTGITENRAAQV